jgi:homeobox protein cut-like
VKVTEAEDLEAELHRLREENTELRRRANESAAIESSRKKLELKIEQLELKVRVLCTIALCEHSISDQMEEVVQEKVSQKENELNATYDEKLRNYEERCDSGVPTPSVH